MVVPRGHRAAQLHGQLRGDRAPGPWTVQGERPEAGAVQHRPDLLVGHRPVPGGSPPPGDHRPVGERCHGQVQAVRRAGPADEAVRDGVADRQRPGRGGRRGHVDAGYLGGVGTFPAYLRPGHGDRGHRLPRPQLDVPRAGPPGAQRLRRGHRPAQGDLRRAAERRGRQPGQVAPLELAGEPGDTGVQAHRAEVRRAARRRRGAHGRFLPPTGCGVGRAGYPPGYRSGSTRVSRPLPSTASRARLR